MGLCGNKVITQITTYRSNHHKKNNYNMPLWWHKFTTEGHKESKQKTNIDVTLKFHSSWNIKLLDRTVNVLYSVVT